MQKHKIKSIIMFVIAGILITVGTLVLPEVTNLGSKILHLLIGVGILIYVFGYLFRKEVLKHSGHILVLSIIELFILLFVAVTCILQEWISINIVKEACKIIGIAFWIRGFIEILRLQIHPITKYNLYKTGFNVLLITAGTWFFIKPPFTNYDLIYELAIIMFVAAIILITTGIILISKGPKKSN